MQKTSSLKALEISDKDLEKPLSELLGSMLGNLPCEEKELCKCSNCIEGRGLDQRRNQLLKEGVFKLKDVINRDVNDAFSSMLMLNREVNTLGREDVSSLENALSSCIKFPHIRQSQPGNFLEELCRLQVINKIELKRLLTSQKVSFTLSSPNKLKLFQVYTLMTSFGLFERSNRASAIGSSLEYSILKQAAKTFDMPEFKNVVDFDSAYDMSTEAINDQLPLHLHGLIEAYVHKSSDRHFLTPSLLGYIFELDKRIAKNKNDLNDDELNLISFVTYVIVTQVVNSGGVVALCMLCTSLRISFLEDYFAQYSGLVEHLSWATEVFSNHQAFFCLQQLSGVGEFFTSEGSRLELFERTFLELDKLLPVISNLSKTNPSQIAGLLSGPARKCISHALAKMVDFESTTRQFQEECVPSFNFQLLANEFGRIKRPFEIANSMSMKALSSVDTLLNHNLGVIEGFISNVESEMKAHQVKLLQFNETLRILVKGNQYDEVHEVSMSRKDAQGEASLFIESIFSSFDVESYVYDLPDESELEGFAKNKFMTTLNKECGLESLEPVVESLKAEVKSLNVELFNSKEQVKSLEARRINEKEIGYSDSSIELMFGEPTIEHVFNSIKEVYPHVVFSDDFSKLIKKCKYKNIKRLHKELKFLVDDYTKAINAGVPDSRAKELLGSSYSANESNQTMSHSKLGKQRLFKFDGELIEMQQHLTIGNAHNEETTVQVYFSLLDGKILLGYVGKHKGVITEVVAK